MRIEWNRVTWYSQIVAIVLGILIFAVGFRIGRYAAVLAPETGASTNTSLNPAAGGSVINDVTFRCDSGKTIRAIFKQRLVQILLSDGRNLTLPQTISADGGRYANADESFVFWTKGDGAFITEAGKNTYANCVVVPNTTL